MHFRNKTPELTIFIARNKAAVLAKLEFGPIFRLQWANK